MSYNFCIVCADSKTCQTFDFTLRNRPILAEMVEILANIGKYWPILPIFANIDVHLFNIMLGFGLLMPNHTRMTQDLARATRTQEPRLCKPGLRTLDLQPEPRRLQGQVPGTQMSSLKVSTSHGNTRQDMKVKVS